MESPWTLGILGCIGYFFVITSYRVPTAVPFIALALASIALRINTLRISAAQMALFAFGAWAMMSVVGSSFPREAFDGLVVFVKVAVIALMIAWSIQSRAQLLLLLSVYLLFFLAFPVRGSLISYYLYRAGAFSGFGSTRATWNYAFGNPNDLATFCLLTCGLASTLALLTPHRWVRRSAMAAVGAMLLVILLTQSRSGLLGLVTSVGGAIVLMRLYRHRLFWIVGTVGVGVLLFLTPRAAFDRYLGIGKLTSLATVQAADPEGSADQRLEIMRVAMSITRDAPIFGVGLGAYSRVHGEYAARFGFRRTAMGERDAHNSYLRLSSETGLPGLGLFLLTMILTARETHRARRAFPRGSSEHFALTTLNLTWLGFAVCALFGSLGMVAAAYVQLGFAWAAARVLQGPPKAPIRRRGGPWLRGQPTRGVGGTGALRGATRGDLRHVPVT